MQVSQGRPLSFENVDTPGYLLTVGIVIALVLIAGVVLMAVRRRLLSGDARADDAGIFENLRRMRDRGDISVEEYDRARRTLVEKLASRKDPPSKPG